MAKKYHPSSRKDRRDPYARRATSGRTSPPRNFSPSATRSSSSPCSVRYERRNSDLDPQLVWRGKDEQDWSDLVVHAPPLYIQEKVHPKVLIDDLLQADEGAAKR